jgi:hypothetical protein
MSESTVNADEFFNEVGYGEVVVHIVDGKLYSVPKQVIQRPGKVGVDGYFFVHKPINFKAA